MEELNQVQTEQEEGLFDDWSSDESTAEPTETTDSSEPNEEPVETQAPSFALNVKYNGEEKTLTEEEARTFAQKGMNYDKIYGPLERLARMNGVTVGEYMNNLNETQIAYEVSKEINNLKSNPRYADISDEVLEEIAQRNVQDSIGLKDQQYQQDVQSHADEQQALVRQEVDRFLDEYPEFKNKGPESLDPKVYDYVKNGYSLLEAYNKWSREQESQPSLQAKAKNQQLNEENKRKSLGNTSTAGGGDTDAFLSGFLKG